MPARWRPTPVHGGPPRTISTSPRCRSLGPPPSDCAIGPQRYPQLWTSTVRRCTDSRWEAGAITFTFTASRRQRRTSTGSPSDAPARVSGSERYTVVVDAARGLRLERTRAFRPSMYVECPVPSDGAPCRPDTRVLGPGRGRKWMDETDVPTQRAQARQDTRLSQADVDQGGAGRDPGALVGEGTPAPVGVNPGRPAGRGGGAVVPVRSRRTFADLRRPSGRGRHGPVSVSFVDRPDWDRCEVAYAVGRKVGQRGPAQPPAPEDAGDRGRAGRWAARPAPTWCAAGPVGPLSNSVN